MFQTVVSTKVLFKTCVYDLHTQVQKMNQKLKLSYGEIVEKSLTSWICSILQSSSKKELRTTEIYREIKQRYPDAIKKEYNQKLNKRTVLNNLNLLAKYKILKKRIDKNTSAYWSLGKNALPMEKILEETDKRYIDVCSKVSSKNFFGGSVNVYGFYKPQSELFNFDSEENIIRFNNAVQKLREGMNEIQALIDEGIGWNLAYDVFMKYLKNKKYPVLDRQLFLVLHFYGYQPVGLEEQALLERWLDFKDDSFIISQPDKVLVEAFQKLFYPSESYKKVHSMLEGYKLNKDLSMALIKTGIFHLLKMESHVVAVVHSYGGFTRKIPNIKSKIEKQQRSLKFSDLKSELNFFSIDAKDAYDRYYKEYFNSQNKYVQYLLKEIKKQKFPQVKRLEKLMKHTTQKQNPNFNDLLTIYKELFDILDLIPI